MQAINNFSIVCKKCALVAVATDKWDIAVSTKITGYPDKTVRLLCLTCGNEEVLNMQAVSQFQTLLDYFDNMQIEGGQVNESSN